MVTGERATAPVSLTDAQLAVVLDDSARLLIDAGAGSGKTTTVVEKICYLLGADVQDRHGTVHRVRHPLALRDIAAITFTNQAAAELKRKLRRRLLAAGMRDQAEAIDGARIGTIHAFCADVLRTHALCAGLPPSLRVLDEGDASSVHELAARGALQRAAAANPGALAPLLAERRLTHVVSYIARIASDTHRLAVWSAHRDELRAHEVVLLDLAVDAWRERTKLLEANAAIDFDRLVSLVCELLATHADIRRAVRRETRLLVIDEFQDVDPPQRDIALHIAGLSRLSPVGPHDARRDSADGDDSAHPAPTRLVLVGDPKQSIYRFRRADVSLWNATQRAFASDASARVLPLRENFRSRAGILGLVDGFVGDALARPVHEDGIRREFEVEYVPLIAAGAHAGHDIPAVELLLVPCDADGAAVAAAAVRECEARAIAHRIRELHAAGTGYRDIAILLSTWSSLSTFDRALRDAGIPTQALRSDGFWDAREIVDCLLALRAIDDPDDRVALLGFLKSPFVGVRDDTLYALATSREGAATALRTELRERAALDRAADILDRFAARRDRMPLHRFIDTLVRETGFLDALPAMPRGDQAMANLRQLVRFAASSSAVSLREFLDSVAEVRARGDGVAEASLHDPGADVVAITSIHSAKGLEWPVVFWSDLVHEPRTDAEPLQCGARLFRLAHGLRTEGDDGVDADHDALRSERRLEALAEQFRLWYVAATRPQRLLVMTGIPLGTMRGRSSVASWLRRHFAAALDDAASPGSGAGREFTIPYTNADGASFHLAARVVHDDRLG